MSVPHSGTPRPVVPKLKITAPARPAGLVPRPRLLAILDDAAEAAVTVVRAPAGTGKTWLLADWAHAATATTTAWTALDRDDNDERRFFAALLDALAAAVPAGDGVGLTELAVPAHPGADAGFLAEMIDAVERLPAPVRLIMDNLQEIVAPEPLRGLGKLLRHRPAGLRLVLSTRLNPPLPLARLHLAGQVRHLPADELAFTAGETAALLDHAGVSMSPEQLRELVERTGGWVAGVRLAADALRDGHGHEDGRDGFLSGFPGHHRVLTDYLLTEVCADLPGPAVDLLRAISVCAEVPADLAAALSGQADAADLLDGLQHQTALVSRVEGPQGSYRVRTLLRAALLADLQQTTPDRAAALHGIAADWLAQAHRPADAVDHAERAGDQQRLAALLRTHTPALIAAGAHAVARDGLAELGEQAIVGDAGLALLAAWLDYEAVDHAAANAHLACAEAAWPADPTPELELVRSLVSAQRAQANGDLDDLRQRSAQLAWATVAEPAVRELALLHQGQVRLARGAHQEARQATQAALDGAQANGHHHLAAQCLTILSAAAAAEGDFRRMTELAQCADTILAGAAGPPHPVVATARLRLAYGALLRAEPRECLEQATRVARPTSGAVPARPGADLPVSTLSGAGLFDAGDRAAGLRLLGDARLGRVAVPRSDECVALAATLEHRAASVLGEGRISRAVLAWAQTMIPESGELLLMRARTQLTLGRHSVAAHLLRRLLDGTAQPVLAWSIVDAWLLEAEIALRCGEQRAAGRAVERALALAEPMNVWHPVVFAPPAVISLLTRQLGRLDGAESFAAAVLAVRRSLGPAALPVSLTERERGVLRLLPTQRSFDEIARDLTVSPNTVKTHVRKVYSKLGVGSRRAAVTAAREQGLLATPPATDFLADTPEALSPSSRDQLPW